MSNYVLLTPLFHPQSIDYFSDRLLVRFPWPVQATRGDVLRGECRCDLPLDDVYDESTHSFSKYDLLGEAALKQHAYSVVAGHFSGSNQRLVFTNVQMNPLAYLGQNVKLPCDRRLDVGQLLTEILDEDLLQAVAQLYRVVTDELEALIELFDHLLREEYSRL